MIKKLLGWLRGLWKTSKTKKAIAIEVPIGADYIWYTTVCKKYGLKPSPFFMSDYIQHGKYMYDVLYRLIWEKNQAVTNFSKKHNKIVDYAMVRSKHNIKADTWIRSSNIGEM